jgi:predicted RNase H-like nuclease (RuvC/YqgF family)
MSPTNIELYEALKKDLSEEAARMIAEIVQEDVATEGDIARLDQTIARLEQTIARLEQTIDRLESTFRAEQIALEARLKSYIDSRLLRYTAAIAVPMGLTMLGTVGALIGLVIKL